MSDRSARGIVGEKEAGTHLALRLGRWRIPLWLSEVSMLHRTPFRALRTHATARTFAQIDIVALRYKPDKRRAA